jgi:hypothetical protein
MRFTIPAAATQPQTTGQERNDGPTVLLRDDDPDLTEVLRGRVVRAIDPEQRLAGASGLASRADASAASDAAPRCRRAAPPTGPDERAASPQQISA